MKRKLLWTTLLGTGIGVLVLLLVLIGIGYLRLPPAPQGTVSVSEIHWTLEEGTTASGQGWFGPSEVNQTSGQGLPQTYTSGTTFALSWSAFNRDNVSHTVYSISVLPPFSFGGAQPTLPGTVPAADDGFGFTFDFSTASSTTGTYILEVTVNCLSGG